MFRLVTKILQFDWSMQLFINRCSPPRFKKNFRPHPTDTCYFSDVKERNLTRVGHSDCECRYTEKATVSEDEKKHILTCWSGKSPPPPRTRSATCKWLSNSISPEKKHHLLSAFIPICSKVTACLR